MIVRIESAKAEGVEVVVQVVVFEDDRLTQIDAFALPIGTGNDHQDAKQAILHEAKVRAQRRAYTDDLVQFFTGKEWST